MLYILNQNRNMSIPIKDGYIVYIRMAEDKEIYDIIVDANPELSSKFAKTEYFLGRYFSNMVATEVIKYINKLRSVGYAHYVMPDEDEEKQLRALRDNFSEREVNE